MKPTTACVLCNKKHTGKEDHKHLALGEEVGTINGEAVGGKIIHSREYVPEPWIEEILNAKSPRLKK